MWLTILLLSLGVVLLFIRKSNTRAIPGPIGLPILGYYPFLGKQPMITLHKLSDKYGEIMKIKLLGEDYYILSSLETVKEALVKQADNFMNRPVNDFNILSSYYGKKGFIHAELDTYLVQKKFLIPKLTSMGMTKSDFECRIHELCEDLVEELRRRKLITNLGELLSNVASNVIMRLVFNEKYDMSDPTYVELLHDVEVLNEGFDYLNMILVGKLFYLKCRLNFKLWRRIQRSRKRLINFMLNHIKNRAANKEYPPQYNDLLDYFLEQSSGPNGQYFEFKTLAAIFLLFMFAGTDTTASTTFHGITLMAKYPKIQQEVLKELELFDKESRIWYNDIENLHYTRACIAEIQRFTCSVPLNVIHINSEATTINGHVIPKGSKVVANIWKLSRDKKHFNNPNNFDPNNFLDENGKFIPSEANIPFGIGKRMCIGFKLAEIELVVLFTNLIRKFEWCAPEGESVKYEVFEGGVRTLLPNRLIAKPRL